MGQPDPKGRLWTICESVAGVYAPYAQAPYPSTNIALNYLVIMVSITGTCVNSGCASCQSAPAMPYTDVVNRYTASNGQL